MHTKYTLVQKAYRSNWTIAVYCITIVLIVALIGLMFFVRGKIIMENEVKDKLRGIAAAAAMQFDGDILTTIVGPQDMSGSSYITTRDRLKRIKDTIPAIRSAYIMRRTMDPNELAFIVDGDEAIPLTERDSNRNGTIDPEEEPAIPGQLYDISKQPTMKSEAFLHPSVDEEINTDQWGTVISGYAPIVDSTHKTVAILGIDMDAEDYINISHSIFSPLAFLLIILSAIMIAGTVIFYISSRQLEILKRLDLERAGLLRLAFHQLGSPLTILNWSLEMLKDRKENEPIDKYVASMEEGMSRLGNILNSLRDADQVHEGTILYQPEVASLRQIITHIAREFEPRLERYRQKLVLSLDSETKMMLDKKMIDAVLRELLGNSIDFSPPGSTTTIRVTQTVKHAQIEVHDQGYGIPEVDMKRMFEEFARASNANKYKPDGSGLGLYIVRGIVERAGGRIWLESKQGKGTSVYIQLPIA
ncbi:MAG: HAMP domain-containing histidine kinase [Candidatus Peribacteraceae bacterium]|nr:HAMP domain-containing histidine kinase [Candidatus Peribacteraceae bacterium]